MSEDTANAVPCAGSGVEVEALGVIETVNGPLRVAVAAAGFVPPDDCVVSRGEQGCADGVSSEEELAGRAVVVRCDAAASETTGAAAGLGSRSKEGSGAGGSSSPEMTEWKRLRMSCRAACDAGGGPV